MTPRDAEIVRRYVAGETSETIGRSLGLSRERVWQIVRRQAQMRPPGTRKLISSGSTKEQKLVQLWTEGKSARKIAEELGCSARTVFNVISDLSLPKNNRRWARKIRAVYVPQWTEPMLADLAAWYARYPASQVARRLSSKYRVTVTRNAVIGRVRRLRDKRDHAVTAPDREMEAVR